MTTDQDDLGYTKRMLPREWNLHPEAVSELRRLRAVEDLLDKALRLAIMQLEDGFPREAEKDLRGTLQELRRLNSQEFPT